MSRIKHQEIIYAQYGHRLGKDADRYIMHKLISDGYKEITFSMVREARRKAGIESTYYAERRRRKENGETAENEMKIEKASKHPDISSKAVDQLAKELKVASTVITAAKDRATQNLLKNVGWVG